MARSTFKVLFYVNGSKEKDGVISIMERVTINGTVAQFSWKQTIPKTPLGCKKQPSQRQACTLSNKSAQLKLQLNLGFWFRIINKKVYLHNDNVNRIPDNIWQIVIELSLEHPELTPRELSVLLLEESHIFVSELSFYRILHERGLL